MYYLLQNIETIQANHNVQFNNCMTNIKDISIKKENIKNVQAYIYINIRYKKNKIYNYTEFI